MSDSISRQDAIEIFDERREELTGIYGDLGGAMSGVVKIIKEMPSAERKGRWMPHPNADYPEWDVCTCCGTGCKRREYGVENGKTWVTEYSYQYCPNCGASME